MKNKILTALTVMIILGWGNTSKAQDYIIHGEITTFKRIPLNNVKVESLKSGEISFSSLYGEFSIGSFRNDILRIKAYGFNEKKLKVRKQTNFKVDLDLNMDESSIRSAVDNKHISEEMVLKVPIENSAKLGKDYSKYQTIFELINSEIFDVSVFGSRVYNTKLVTHNLPSEVLYVTNGVVVPDISDILPVKVRNIEFIDGIGATTYGIQGANGVLNITLK